MNYITSLSPLLSTSLALLLVLVGNAFSAGRSASADNNLEPLAGLLDDGEYRDAIEKLRIELDSEPNDPDTLTLLGFNYYQLNQQGEALAALQSALGLEPEHRSANRYLGELYLELGQPQQSRQRLEVLKGLSFFASAEYIQLKDKIEQYEQQA